MNYISITRNVFPSSVITLLLFLLTSTSASAQGLCDAYFLTALKDQYHGIESQTIQEAIYEASCETQQDKRGTTVDILSQYGNLSFGDNRSSLRTACVTKDRRYFQDNYRDIMYSHLPKEAFSLLSGCFGGLTLTAEREGSQNVRIKATWIPQLDGELAIVDRLEISDPQALKCNNTSFTSRATLIPGEKSILCTLHENRDISITLVTKNKGSKGVWIKKEPTIEIVNYNWDYNVYGKSGSYTYTCKNQFGEVGAQERYIRQMVRNKDAVLKGSCLMRFGGGKVIIDGKELEPPLDSWSYKTYPGQSDPRKIQCLVNGNPRGGMHVSTVDGTWGSDFAIQSLCAGRYGLKRSP